MWTRREILKAFLGLPFLMACDNRSKIENIAGEIVGADVLNGHKILSNPLFEVSNNNRERKTVVIVGGGVSGLSAAWKLKRDGFNDFILLELEPKIGGTSQSGENELTGYPWGAHYLPVPFKENSLLITLLDEMNLIEGRTDEGEVIIKEEFLCRQPEERVFYKGRWYEGLYLHVGENDQDKIDLENFQKEIDFWIDWRDSSAKRAFTLPVANCSEDAFVNELDKISFEDWLRQKGFSSERLFWYCDYACRDDYGLKLHETSAWAGLFYFCSRVRKSGEESQPFITFPEGNGRFVKHFYSKVKENVKLKSLVCEIIPKEDSIEVVYLDISDKKYRLVEAQKVIFSAPIFTAKHIIRDFKENMPSYLKEFEHNAWFVANLFLKDRPKPRFNRDFPLSWDNVIYESPSLGYVCATHQSGIDYGATVFTYYYPMCAEKDGRAKLFSLSWKELTDIILTDLWRAHRDIYSLVERIDIMRWGHAMISPRVGFVRSEALKKAKKPYRGIHFANTDLSGVALFEEAFYHGTRAAEEIWSDLRR
ncbi:MAG: FAD-dependent oxidoreductase [Pyrinomonadaceae bacterium]|nr:FAD-dependent oxidoreductase [Pyrinomonadaceae bacterium]